MCTLCFVTSYFKHYNSTGPPRLIVSRFGAQREPLTLKRHLIAAAAAAAAADNNNNNYVSTREP